MGKHGLVTWGDEPKATYDHTLAIIQAAEDFIAHKASGRRLFGAVTVPELGTIAALGWAGWLGNTGPT